MEGTSSSFSSSPSDYVCRGNQVTVSGSVDYSGRSYSGCSYGYYGDGSATIEVSDIGSYSQTLSRGNNSVSHSFDTSSVSGDSITITVTIDGETVYTNSVYVVRLDDLLAYAGTNGTTALAVSQLGAFKAQLNTYAGNNSDWGPSCLTFNNANQTAGTSWASNSWSYPSCQNVSASLGNNMCIIGVYVVKATISALTFTGNDYADVNKDSDGDPYLTPHYDVTVPNYCPPVQYKRGAQPTMDLKFNIEPQDFDGDIYVYGSGSLFSTCTNSSTPCAGVAQLSGLQAIDALPNEVGYDDSFIINWHFSVANNEFYSANSSQHKIYRTLNSPSAHYHTSVDVACNGVSGSDETSVFGSVWGKFTGLNITSADGYPMTYYGTNNTPTTLFGLISTHYGDCTAWASFFVDCLSVHNISAIIRRILPPEQATGFLDGVPPEMGIISSEEVNGLKVKNTLEGQNNSNPETDLNFHEVVYYNSVIYDPSYGQTFSSLAQWDATCVFGFFVKYIYNGQYRNGVILNSILSECRW